MGITSCAAHAYETMLYSQHGLLILGSMRILA